MKNLSYIGTPEGLMNYLQEEQWREEYQRSKDLEDLMNSYEN